MRERERERERERVWIVPIIEKMVEYCLRWFGYIWMRPIEVPIGRVDQMESSPLTKDKMRPKKI